MCGNPPLSHPKNIGIKMIARPLLCHASGQRKRQAQPAILETGRISCPALQVSHALIYELFTVHCAASANESWTLPMKKGLGYCKQKLNVTGKMDTSDGDGEDRETLADRLEEQQRAWKVLFWN